ncbi:MAG TPA: hypothetical protein VIV11_19065 [Kofleriaceae bacterium]
MRVVLITLLLASCTGEPKLVMKPLPPLVEPTAHTQRLEIVVNDLGLVAGEEFLWDVQVRGFSIGKARMSVHDETVQSRFHTGALASAVANVAHDLVTSIDRTSARPYASSERVEAEGKVRQFATQFSGTTAHSFHTALGAIRAWAKPDAPRGFLNVVHADQVFRLELESPLAQQAMLRVDGHVIGPDVDLALTIWLDPERVPARIEIRDGEDQVTAQLIDD